MTAEVDLAVERSPHTRRIPYDPSLDGLRAIAVIAVMLYHADVGWAPAGFLGVDLFFVLSGYLITTLLIVEYNTSGRVDLRAFWIRRARRLLPALLAVVAVIVVAGAQLSRVEPGNTLRPDVISSLLYVQNWNALFSGNSYFALFTDPSPLVHTWSLAIEEQWYLVWPLMFVLLVRLRSSAVRLSLIAALACGSAVAMAVVANEADPSRAYYGTDTRAQALLIGAILALSITRFERSVVTTRRSGALAAVALAGWMAFVLLADDSQMWMYRGGFTAVAVFAAVTVGDLRTNPQSLVARVLATRPLASLGRVSYSAYLWHWPVFLVFTEERVGVSGASLVFVRCGIAITIAYLSFFALERPMSAFVGVNGIRAFGLFVGAIALAIVAGMTLPTAPKFAESVRIPAPPRETATTLAHAATTTVPLTAVAESDELRDEPAEAATTTVEPRVPPRVLIVGDSVWLEAGYWFDLNRRSPDGPALAFDVRLGCGSLSDTSRDKCDGRLNSWRLSVGIDDPDIVIMPLSHWDSDDVVINGVAIEYGSEEYEAMLRESWTENIAVLSSTAAHVVMMSVPCYAAEGQIDPDVAPRVSPERTEALNLAGEQFVKSTDGDVTWLDIRTFTCPSGAYVDTIDGIQIHRDGIHFSQEFMPLLWDWMLEQITLIDDAIELAASQP